MKTMKSFLVMLLVATMPMLITSCEKDDIKEPTSSNEEYEDLIIGEWECVELTYTYEYEGEGDSESEDLSVEDFIWEFDKDGELTIYYDGDREGKFDYSVKDNKLYTEYAEEMFDEVEYFTIKKLTEKKLVLLFEYEDEREDYYMSQEYSLERI